MSRTPLQRTAPCQFGASLDGPIYWENVTVDCHQRREYGEFSVLRLAKIRENKTINSTSTNFLYAGLTINLAQLVQVSGYSAQWVGPRFMEF